MTIACNCWLNCTIAIECFFCRKMKLLSLQKCHLFTQDGWMPAKSNASLSNNVIVSNEIKIFSQIRNWKPGRYFEKINNQGDYVVAIYISNHVHIRYIACHCACEYEGTITSSRGSADICRIAVQSHQRHGISNHHTTIIENNRAPHYWPTCHHGQHCLICFFMICQDYLDQCTTVFECVFSESDIII